MIEKQAILDKIRGMVENPDTAAFTATELEDQLGQLYNEVEAAGTARTAAEARVKELQEQNIKLYLSTAGSSRPEPAEEKTGADWFEARLREIEKEHTK